MKKMTLKDVQSVSLDILSDVHEFCVNNNIKYSLAGGTLIGAIRHKGFIPWDDDVDIVMPRPDYDRFMKTYHSNKGYKALSLVNDKNVYVAYGRVYEDELTIAKTTIPWTNRTTGLWIDIFPLDGCEDDIDIVAKRINRIRRYARLAFIQRSVRFSYSQCNGIAKKLKWIIKKPTLLLGNIAKKWDKECRTVAYGTTNHICAYSFVRYGVKEFRPIETFADTKIVQFEDRQVCITTGYDQFLRLQFGDYMKLPPAEKRVPIHSFQTNYWK